MRSKFSQFSLTSAAACAWLFMLTAVPGWLSASEVEKAPLPDWVAPARVEMDREYDSDTLSDGVRYHHSETQTTTVGGNSRYVRVVYELLIAEAVSEHSSLSFSFRPEDQALALHHLTVIRDGERLERLDGQEVRILQREASLERNLYDGRVSAHLLLEDIRVGDIIDYGYSIRGGGEVFGGRFFAHSRLEYDTQVGRIFIRHLGDPSRPFHHRTHFSDLEPRIRELEDGVEYIWERLDVPGFRREPDTPWWYRFSAHVEMGELSEWGEVVEWALPLYTPDEDLPEEVLAKAEEWRDLDPSCRIAEALRFVQSEIRYVAVAIGPHSHTPYQLGQIWGRRFGDCKDKSLLLVALLRHLGFEEVWPALVETDFGRDLPDVLPSPQAFDHVLVLVRHEGEDYWLEPTDSRQEGPLERIFSRDLGYALVIREGETQLRRMRPQGYEHSFAEIGECFTVSRYGGPVTFTVETRNHGAEADRFRASFRSRALSETAEQYASFYRRIYPNLRATTLPQIEDDTEANVFIIREEYEIDDFFVAGDNPEDDYSGLLRAAIIDDMLTFAGNRERTMPHHQRFPSRTVQTLRLHLPEGTATFTPETTRHEAPSIFYTKDSIQEGDTLVVRHEYQTLRDHVKPEEIEEFRNVVDSIYQSTDYQIVVPAAFFEEEGGAESHGIFQEGDFEANPQADADATAAVLRLTAGAAPIPAALVIVLLIAFLPSRKTSILPQSGAIEARNRARLPLAVLGGAAALSLAVHFVLRRQRGEMLRLHLGDALNPAVDGAVTPEVGIWIVAEYAYLTFALPLAILALWLLLSRGRRFAATFITLNAISFFLIAPAHLLGVHPEAGAESSSVPAIVFPALCLALFGVSVALLLRSPATRLQFTKCPGRSDRGVAPPPLPPGPFPSASRPPSVPGSAASGPLPPGTHNPA